MTAWPGVSYWYFAIDSLDDLSGSVLKLGAATDSIDSLPVTADHVTDTDILTRLNSASSAPSGYTRYWWSALLGSGQDIALTVGRNSVIGLLTDTPESLPRSWVIYAAT